MMAPRPSCVARDLDWSAGDWWPKAMPPFWQYLSRLRTSPSLPSKGQVECGVTSLGLSAMLALVNALAGAVFDA
jgi:hypothetical protein